MRTRRFLALIFGVVIALTLQPLASATTLVTITGTLGFTDPATGAIRPVVQVPIQFSSGTTSANQTTYTNSSGQYSVTLPAGPNYTVMYDWMPAASDPLPAFVSVILQQLTFSENSSLNITLPAAFKVTATMKDQAGNPLPGATISLGVGSSYGSFSSPVISGYAGTYTPLAVGFGSARGYNPVRYAADAQGVATMWAFDFRGPIIGYQQYVSPSGYSLNSTFSFTPQSDVALNLTFNIPSTVAVSGTFAYTDSAGSAVPINSAPVSFSSGSLGISRNVVTNASGGFTVTLPSATDYSMTLEPVFLEPGYTAGTPLPAAAWIQLRDLNFSVSREINLRLPKATPISVTVKDQAGQPLVGARVQLATGSFYGSSSVLTISGYSLPVTQMLNFSSSYDDKPRVVLTDSSGVATLHVFDFANTMNGDVRYRTESGVWLASTFSFNPAQTQSAATTITVPPSVTVSGRLAYTRSDGSIAPLVSKTFTLSSASGGSKAVSTDAQGNYSTSLGAASDYSLQLGWLPGTSDPLPGSVSLILQNLDFSATRILDLTFPAAKQTRVRVVDAQGNPLTGAHVSYGVGSSFGSSTRPVFGTFGESSTVLMSFGGGQGSYVKRFPVDDNGIATVWSLGFQNPISGLVTFQVPGGFTSYREFSFTPDSTREVTIEFDNILLAQSLGYNPGGLTMFTPVGTSIEGFSIAPSRANNVPDGAFDLTGVLSYEVRGLSLGQSVAVQFNLPEGIPPTDVFKVINDELVDISTLATISGRTVTLMLRDGGPGDDDGTINGVIVDPVVFVSRSTGSSTSSSSTSTSLGTSVPLAAGAGQGGATADTSTAGTPTTQSASKTETVTAQTTSSASAESAKGQSAIVGPSAVTVSGEALSLRRKSGLTQLLLNLGKPNAKKQVVVSVKRPGSRSFVQLTRLVLNGLGKASLSRALPAGAVVRISLNGRTVDLETVR